MEMKMKAGTLLIAFAALHYLSIAGFAQHGRGNGGGIGSGVGREPGPGISGNMPGRANPSESSPTPDPRKSSRPERGREPSTTAPRTVSQQLQQNTQLSSKLQGLQPAGTNLQTASSGFRNLGQFAAAVHVSHNLGIPFDQLKAKITGGESLGQAIHGLKPNVNAKEEARKAEKEAKEDQKEAKEAKGAKEHEKGARS